jgi:apolipoprotein N-acyltransferase
VKCYTARGLGSVLGFLLSLGIVALGQPARAGWLGALASAFGFALFFASLPPFLLKVQRFLLGSLWFTAVQMIQLSWMTSIEFQGYYILFVYLFLSIGLGCQFGLLAVLVPASGRIPLFTLLYCSAFWTLMEWSRLFFICGFSWNPTGMALTHNFFSLQFASAIGVFGLSFWILLTNLAALNVWRENFKKTLVAGWLLLIAFPYLFGAAHLAYHFPKSEKQRQTIDAALVQTALLPSEKIPHNGRSSEFISAFVQWERIIKGLQESCSSNWGMIVLPEAAVPLQSDRTLYPFEAVRTTLVRELGPSVVDNFPDLSYPFAEKQMVNGSAVICVSNLFWCQTLANYFDAELVVGLDHTDRENQKNFNSAFYLRPQESSIKRYDKQVLLPLAEYLPLDFLKPLTKGYGIFDFFTRGGESKVFGEKIPFSPSICYEETFTEVMREGRSKGAQLFVNLTNDNYYPDSSLHEQHLFHARIRAVENGIPLIRSCNSGVSAAVDSFGRIAARMESPRSFSSSRTGVLTCSLNAYHFFTPFSFWGDGLIIGYCMIICLFFWRRKLRN